jgi:hypothetical protein
MNCCSPPFTILYRKRLENPGLNYLIFNVNRQQTTVSEKFSRCGLSAVQSACCLLVRLLATRFLISTKLMSLQLSSTPHYDLISFKQLAVAPQAGHAKKLKTFLLHFVWRIVATVNAMTTNTGRREMFVRHTMITVTNIYRITQWYVSSCSG